MLSEWGTVSVHVINAGKAVVSETWRCSVVPTRGMESPGRFPGGGDTWAEA